MKRYFFLLVAAALSSQAQIFNINPFLSCVSVDPDTQAVTVYWGYESFEQSPVQVLIGQDNQFIPSPASQNQPVLFYPGLHDKAFRMQLIGGFVEWSLVGTVVSALPSSTPCVTPPSLPPGVVGAPYAQQLAAIGGQAAPTWSATGFPTGLTISSSGEISGTPQVSGQFTIAAQASDGTTTSSRTYGLTVSNGLTISDPASTRAPGFTPQFRLATMPSSGISATASCNLNEFLITGGGTCTVPNVNTVQGRVASSQPGGNAWTVTCSGGAATALAVCSLK